MFGIGEYVSSNKGVCKVDQITTLDISGVDKDEQYYILKPVYSTGSTVYVPVEMAEESLRPILSRKEAAALVKELPKIPEKVIENEKFLEQEYKNCVRSNDVRELVSLLKTIYKRKCKRLEAGRKETAMDAKYSHMAEDILYGELAISLEMTREEIQEYLVDKYERV